MVEARLTDLIPKHLTKVEGDFYCLLLYYLCPERIVSGFEEEGAGYSRILSKNSGWMMLCDGTPEFLRIRLRR